jgi:hypothetical protein
MYQSHLLVKPIGFLEPFLKLPKEILGNGLVNCAFWKIQKQIFVQSTLEAYILNLLIIGIPKQAFLSKSDVPVPFGGQTDWIFRALSQAS